MFEKFINKFEISVSPKIEDDRELYKSLPVSLFTLFDLHGGKSCNSGLYRLHTFGSSVQWSLIIGQCFKTHKNKIYPFGFDWMGRQFCMSIDNNNLLFMFDIATAEYFELQQKLELLHDDDFINDMENMLANDIFTQVLKHSNLKSIGYNECLGYKMPLFMGGNDVVENYQLIDIEVYWETQYQLYEKVKNLPVGTIIKSIKIE